MLSMVRYHFRPIQKKSFPRPPHGSFKFYRNVILKSYVFFQGLLPHIMQGFEDLGVPLASQVHGPAILTIQGYALE
jgi:hypothetical protein